MDATNALLHLSLLRSTKTGFLAMMINVSRKERSTMFHLLSFLKLTSQMDVLLLRRANRISWRRSMLTWHSRLQQRTMPWALHLEKWLKSARGRTQVLITKKHLRKFKKSFKPPPLPWRKHQVRQPQVVRPFPWKSLHSPVSFLEWWCNGIICTWVDAPLSERLSRGKVLSSFLHETQTSSCHNWHLHFCFSSMILDLFKKISQQSRTAF